MTALWGKPEKCKKSQKKVLFFQSVVSWETAQGIEQLRLACGGHGERLIIFPESLLLLSKGNPKIRMEHLRNGLIRR